MDGEIEIRRMRDDPADYEAMRRWLNDPQVMEFVHGRDRPLYGYFEDPRCMRASFRTNG